MNRQELCKLSGKDYLNAIREFEREEAIRRHQIAFAAIEKEYVKLPSLLRRQASIWKDI